MTFDQIARLDSRQPMRRTRRDGSPNVRAAVSNFVQLSLYDGGTTTTQHAQLETGIATL